MKLLSICQWVCKKLFQLESGAYVKVYTEKKTIKTFQSMHGEDVYIVSIEDV